MEVKTACPLNCWDVCSFNVTIDKGKIIDITGDKENPITNGIICGKGRALKDRVYHSARLTKPLKKINGQFQEISWEQALNEIATKMKELKERYTPLSILHSYDYASGGLLKNLEQRFFNLFGGFTEVVGSLCWGAGIEAQKYDFGTSLSHDPTDIINAKTIIIWGRNVTDTNIHLYLFLLKAKEKGTKLIVIDPLQTKIAKKADYYLQIKPGFDGILAMAIAKYIIEIGKADDSFIENYTIGFEQYKKELNKYSLDYYLNLLDLKKEKIIELANYFIDNSPVLSFFGLGMQRYGNGGNTIRAIDALHALTGNIGKSGGGVNYANLAVGKSFAIDKLTLPEKREYYRTFTRITQAQEILTTTDPPIKMLFVTRSNPVNQVPNTKQTIEAFKQIETKVVIEMFMTETALLADYVLPTTSVFEEEDIYYGSWFQSYITYGPKIIRAIGEAKSDREIFTELANRLGFGSYFNYSVTEWLELGLSNLKEQGITLNRLKNEHSLRLPLPIVPYQDKKFLTESGKFEFFSEQAVHDKKPATVILSLPNSKKDEERLLKYPYQLISIHPLRSLHSQHQMLYPKDYLIIYVSKELGTKEGLFEGEKVMVYNELGNITGVIKFANLHKEAVIIEEGGLEQFNQNVNNLTPNLLADIGIGSTQYDITVQIKKIRSTI